MSDLIERLRSAPNAYAGYVMHEEGIIPADGRLMHEAADEIEKLRAALKTCVWALRQPLDGWKGECERKALDKARDALKEQR